MKNKVLKVAFTATVATLLPAISFAQGTAAKLHSLQDVLNTLYDQMIPLCSRMIGLGSGIAGFAALWYIAVRVWKHIAASEPIDFYPLLRPFVLGFCVIKFTAVLALINGVLSPTVSTTAAMVGDSNQAITKMLDPASQPAPSSTNTNGDPDKWYQYSHPDNSSTPANTNPIADQFSGFGIGNMIKRWIYELLNILFEAAALCLDTIRTFKLIVLAILGPLCFGLSVFDGFQSSLKQWLARYINVYMWLPVANIFGAIIGKIQANMLMMQQSGASNATVGDTNSAYMIFMLIGIVGYFTVPSIANYIVNAGNHALFQKTASLASSAIGFSTSQIMQGGGTNTGSGGSSDDAGTNSRGSDSGGGNYMKDKLNGKP